MKRTFNQTSMAANQSSKRRKFESFGDILEWSLNLPFENEEPTPKPKPTQIAIVGMKYHLGAEIALAEIKRGDFRLHFEPENKFNNKAVCLRSLHELFANLEGDMLGYVSNKDLEKVHRLGLFDWKFKRTQGYISYKKVVTAIILEK